MAACGNIRFGGSGRDVQATPFHVWMTGTPPVWLTATRLPFHTASCCTVTGKPLPRPCQAAPVHRATWSMPPPVKLPPATSRPFQTVRAVTPAVPTGLVPGPGPSAAHALPSHVITSWSTGCEPPRRIEPPTTRRGTAGPAPSGSHCVVQAAAPESWGCGPPDDHAVVHWAVRGSVSHASAAVNRTMCDGMAVPRAGKRHASARVTAKLRTCRPSR